MRGHIENYNTSIHSLQSEHSKQIESNISTYMSENNTMCESQQEFSQQLTQHIQTFKVITTYTVKVITTYRLFSKAFNIDILGVVSSQFRYLRHKRERKNTIKIG